MPRGHDLKWYALRCAGPDGKILTWFSQHPMIYDPKLGISAALAHFNYDHTCPGHTPGGIYNHDTILKQFKHRGKLIFSPCTDENGGDERHGAHDEHCDEAAETEAGRDVPLPGRTHLLGFGGLARLEVVSKSDATDDVEPISYA